MPRRAGFIVDPRLRGCDTARIVAGRDSWSRAVLRRHRAWVRCGSARRLPSAGRPRRRRTFLLGSLGLGRSSWGGRSRSVCNAPTFSAVLRPCLAQRRGDAAKQARARHRDHLRDQRRIRGGTPVRVAVGNRLIGVTRRWSNISTISRVQRRSADVAVIGIHSFPFQFRQEHGTPAYGCAFEPQQVEPSEADQSPVASRLGSPTSCNFVRKEPVRFTCRPASHSELVGMTVHSRSATADG
jgi:hypothetical protein